MEPSYHAPVPLLLVMRPPSLAGASSTSDAIPVPLPPEEPTSIHGSATTDIVGCCLRGPYDMHVTDVFTVTDALVTTDGDSTDLDDVRTHTAVPDAITFPHIPPPPAPQRRRPQ
jgi:hypothetical protein